MAEYSITIVSGEEGTDTPEVIKNKLESLSGSSRLHASAIQGIEPNGYIDIYDIVSDLEELEGDERLSFNALKDVPSLSGHPDAAAHRDMLQTLTGDNRLSGLSVKLTGAGLEMVTALSALGGANQLSLTKLKDRTKSVIAGCEMALNLRGMGHVIGSQAYRDAYMTNIRAGDFWIQSDPSTVPDAGDGFPGPPPVGGGTISSLSLNGDWFIALIDMSTPPTQAQFWHVDKWIRMPFGQLYANFNWPAWGDGDGSDTKSGIPIPLIKKTDEAGVSFYGSGSQANAVGSIAMGVYTKTEEGANQSIATGKGSKTENYAEHANAAVLMNEPGDLQYSTYPIYHTSSANSPTIVTTPQNPTIKPVSSNIIEIEGTATSEDATVMCHMKRKYLVAINDDLEVTSTQIESVQTNIGTDAEDIALTIAPTVAVEEGWPMGRMNITATGLPYKALVWNLKVSHSQTVFPLNNT